MGRGGRGVWRPEQEVLSSQHTTQCAGQAGSEWDHGAVSRCLLWLLRCAEGPNVSCLSAAAGVVCLRWAATYHSVGMLLAGLGLAHSLSSERTLVLNFMQSVFS